MSDKKNQDIDVELQDDLVEDVEVSDEELEEGMEIDGAKAAADDAAIIKKSAPAQAKAPTTKAGMINAMYTKMTKMKKEDLAASYAKMHEGTSAEETAIVENNFDEDLTALVDSEATLSESFKDKASVIFEAALKSKLSAHVDSLEEQYAGELAEETAKIQNDLVEKVDSYLNYVVEQWMEDNKIAVENGLRTEIAENFMSALHNVFVENYIQVPDAKVDFVDELASKAEELEEQLNASIEANVKLAESVKTLTRQSIVRESSTGLSEAQAEKLKTLVEDIDFDTAATFTKKVTTIKESYFKEAKPEVIAEEASVGPSDDKVVSGQMAAYLQALKIANK